MLAQLIYTFTGNESVLRQFDKIPDLQAEPLWTEDNSINKAERQERLNYRQVMPSGRSSLTIRELLENEMLKRAKREGDKGKGDGANTNS